MSRWRTPERRARTPQERLTSMLVALGNATDAALARLSVDDLVRLHGVDRKTAEYELTITRQRRARPLGEVAG